MLQINASQAFIGFILFTIGCLELTIADDRLISTQWKRSEQAQQGSHWCDAKKLGDSSEEVSCTTEVHFTQKPPSEYLKTIESNLNQIESNLNQIESQYEACLKEHERKERLNKPNVEKRHQEFGFESKKLPVGANYLEAYPPLIVEPTEKATASIIFLHGLDDSKLAYAEQFTSMSLRHMRYIFPHAPRNPVTVYEKLVMPSWFDILGADPESPQDNQGIIESSKILQQLVAKEISDGIPAERIIIGGINQGGVVALYTAFGTNTKIGGVIALSTWLPMNEYFTNPNNTKYNTDVPVLQCHGIPDKVIDFKWGSISHDTIKTFNPNVQFKPYQNLGHTVNPTVMFDVQQFLQDILTNS